ncbi:MAG: ATP-dependent Zn protease [Planktothrix sp. GU0601_MAG3]|nr:MAG: ATP-dependent Zn protease [Planktothrix sp. GU0601_MAG3]
MTISVLLSPVLNISPFIPAGITFFLLGVATLDVFQFQGQGASLLVDGLAGTSASTRERILHHEAGHFLVAYLMEIPIQGYALNGWEAFKQGFKAQGGVQFADQLLWEQLKQGQISSQVLDRYCAVWMAGIAAETLIFKKAEGGREDRDKIIAIWTQLQRPLSEAKIKERWAILQAKTLIETHKVAYFDLVEAMRNRASVEDCCRRIKQFKDGAGC